ncbi:hypothetical protein Gorai_012883 [Gossypium raimondii]|uniref:Uncharacterized protein n=1 Tax=Gossypium raimondii TaxID=29730 RepID=A0A7J8Q3K8_GOSRA|nr:hypothetical protein [Gossypium raimondii]
MAELFQFGPRHLRVTPSNL